MKVTNPHLQKYVEAAKKLGISHDIIDKSSLIKFRKNKKSWEIYKASTPLNPSSNALASTDKDLAKSILKKNGINVPNSGKFHKIDNALNYFRSLDDKEIVVKPNKGISGNGVTILPSNEDEFRSAFKESKKFDKTVLIEQFIEGKDYRLLILGDKMLAAALRLPPYIIGDGKLNIKQLINNFNTKRKDNGLSPIPFDNELKETLESKNYSFDDVIQEGKKVYVRRNSNMSTGGIVEELTQIVDERYINIAIKATKILGLKFAGVDIITKNIKQFSNTYAINELNHNPGLRIHYLPSKGEVIDVATDIQRYIFENI